MAIHEDILNLEDPSHINTSRTPVTPPTVDPKKEKQPGGKKFLPTKVLIIGGMVFIALITLGVVLYVMTSKVKQEDVEFQITGPDTIKSAEDVTFKVEYANNNGRVTMQNTKLVLTPPKGFEFLSASITPSDQQNLTWDLGEVSPKTQQVLEVHAKFYGDVDSPIKLSGALTFTPSTLGNQLTATADYAPVVGAPLVALSLTAPETLDAGAQVTYQLDITNNGTASYDDASVKFALPKGFTSIQQDKGTTSEDAPKYDAQSDSWKIGKLAASQKKTITIFGRLDGANGEQEDIGAQLFLSKDGNNYIQADVSKVTVISSPSISIKQETSLQVVSQGQKVRFLFTVKNTGTSPLTNLTLSDTLDSQIVDPASLQIDSNGTLKGLTVLWDNTVVSSLKLLNPNQEFKIGFTLSPYKSITATGKEFSIVSTPKITTGSQEVPGNPVTVKVATTVDAKGAASAFDSNNNPIGTGPTTPTVGKTTTYRLSFTIVNKYNTLENAKLVCNVPLGTTFVGNSKTTPGTLVFDSTLKNAVWTIGTLNAKTAGDGTSQATGSFDVSVTPTAPNLGEKMTLAKQCAVTGRDTYVNQDITIQLPVFETEKVQ